MALIVDMFPLDILIISGLRILTDMIVTVCISKVGMMDLESVKVLMNPYKEHNAPPWNHTQHMTNTF